MAKIKNSTIIIIIIVLALLFLGRGGEQGFGFTVFDSELGPIELKFIKSSELTDLQSSIALTPAVPVPGETIDVVLNIGLRCDIQEITRAIFFVQGTSVSIDVTTDVKNIPFCSSNQVVISSFSAPTQDGSYVVGMEIQGKVIGSSAISILQTFTQTMVVQSVSTVCPPTTCSDWIFDGFTFDGNGKLYTQTCTSFSKLNGICEDFPTFKQKTECNAGWQIQGTDGQLTSDGVHVCEQLGGAQTVCTPNVLVHTKCLDSITKQIRTCNPQGTAVIDINSNCRNLLGDQLAFCEDGLCKLPDGGGETTTIGTATAIDWSKYSSATDSQLDAATCDNTLECKTGRCIDLVTQSEIGLQAILFPGDITLIKKFLELTGIIGSESEDIAQRTADSLSKTNKKGICFTNFVPTDSENNLLAPPEKCTKPYLVKNKIIIPGTTISFSLPGGEERCSVALTKEEFRRATDSEIVSSICEEDRNCNPRSEFEVECVNQNTAGVLLSKSIGDRIEGLFTAREEPGVCLAKEVGERECGAFIKSLPFFLFF